MFKFGFNKGDEQDAEEQEEKPAVQWYSSQQVKIPSNISEIINEIPKECLLETTYANACKIISLSSSEVMSKLRKSSNETFHAVLEADSQHSDLVAGKYEGGLKTWECTRDLAEYFMENVIDKSSGLKNKNVLDLGCGSGHLGIICLKNGSDVTFQDYNQEVLEFLTIPNVCLNEKPIYVSECARFYSGDWASFLELLNPGKEVDENPVKKLKTDSEIKFDFILSSETIYNKINYKKIYDIVNKLLKKDGIAFIAAKTYYFGVGGSISDFKKFMEKENVFDCTVCWKTQEGVLREILEIKFK